MKRAFFLTGLPGTGKTTIIKKVIKTLNGKKVVVGGFVSSEVRVKGRRVGFKIKDILSGKEGWLAHIKQVKGPKVSKYRVNIHDLEEVGVNSILEALDRADVVVIDEIGPMELFSEKFREAVKKAFETNKPLIGTIHYRVKDSLTDIIRQRDDTIIIEVTYQNRDFLPSKLSSMILNLIEKTAYRKMGKP